MAPYYGSTVRFQNHVNHHTGRLTFHGCWHRSVVPEYKWCPMWESNALYLGSVSCDICGCPKFPHRAKKKLGSKAPSGDRAFQSEFPMEALYGLWLWMIGRRNIIDAPQFWGLFVMLCRCNWGNTHFTCDWCCQAKSETKSKIRNKKANYWYFVAGEMAGASFKRSHFSIVVVPLCGTTPEIQPGSEYPGSAHKSLIQLYFPMKCMT